MGRRGGCLLYRKKLPLQLVYSERLDFLDLRYWSKKKAKGVGDESGRRPLTGGPIFGLRVSDKGTSHSGLGGHLTDKRSLPASKRQRAQSRKRACGGDRRRGGFGKGT